jgi:hypothetical protein
VGFRIQSGCALNFSSGYQWQLGANLANTAASKPVYSIPNVSIA